MQMILPLELKDLILNKTDQRKTQYKIASSWTETRKNKISSSQTNDLKNAVFWKSQKHS